MYNVYVGTVSSSPPVVNESIVEHSHDPDEEHGVGELTLHGACIYAVRVTVFIKSFLCSHSISETACHNIIVTKRHPTGVPSCRSFLCMLSLLYLYTYT